MQSDGEQLHEMTSSSKKKAEDLDVDIDDGVLKKLREARATIKAKFSDEQMLQLCRIMLKFI